mmetsp:Transcript_88564/g.251046  ORF Transcript_88564/g.251046 Transcript_88564/m.251046 type:complete len:270 (+) Transcript_88564:615-1424(+)
MVVHPEERVVHLAVDVHQAEAAVEAFEVVVEAVEALGAVERLRTQLCHVLLRGDVLREAPRADVQDEVLRLLPPGLEDFLGGREHHVLGGRLPDDLGELLPQLAAVAPRGHDRVRAPDRVVLRDGVVQRAVHAFQRRCLKLEGLLPLAAGAAAREREALADEDEVARPAAHVPEVELGRPEGQGGVDVLVEQDLGALQGHLYAQVAVLLRLRQRQLVEQHGVEVIGRFLVLHLDPRLQPGSAAREERGVNDPLDGVVLGKSPGRMECLC